MVKVVSPKRIKGAPHAALLEKKTRGLAVQQRPHHGSPSWRRSQAALPRVVDFRRNKRWHPAKVERLEYDPNRTAHIALRLCYADGERRYIISRARLKWGATLISGIRKP